MPETYRPEHNRNTGTTANIHRPWRVASEKKKITANATSILFTVTLPVANFRLYQDKEEFTETMDIIVGESDLQNLAKQNRKSNYAACLEAMRTQHSRINRRRKILLENELKTNAKGRLEPAWKDLGNEEKPVASHNRAITLSLSQEFDAFHYALESGGLKKDPTAGHSFYSNPLPAQSAHDTWSRQNWRKKVHSANVLIPHEWIKPALKRLDGKAPTDTDIEKYVSEYFIGDEKTGKTRGHEPAFSVTFGAVRRKTTSANSVSENADSQEVLRKHPEQAGEDTPRPQTCRQDFEQWLCRLSEIDSDRAQEWRGVRSNEGTGNRTLTEIVEELAEELENIYRGFGVYVAGVEVRRYPSLIASRTPADIMWDYVNIYFGFDPEAELVPRSEVVDRVDLRHNPNMFAAGIRHAYGVDKPKNKLDTNGKHKYWLSRSLGRITNHVINVLGYSSSLAVGGFVQHHLDQGIAEKIATTSIDTGSAGASGNKHLTDMTDYWLNKHVGYKASEIMTTTTVVHGAKYVDEITKKSVAEFSGQNMHAPAQWENHMKYVMGYACASGNTVAATQLYQYDPAQMVEDCSSQLGLWQVWADRAGVAYQYFPDSTSADHPEQVNLHEFAKLDGICLQHSRYLDAMITARRQALFLEHHSQLLTVATKRLRFFEQDRSHKSLREALQYYRLLQAEFVNYLARLWFQTMNGAPDASALLKLFQKQLHLDEHIEEVRSEEENCQRFVESLDSEVRDRNMRVVAFLTIILLPLTTWYTVTGGFTQTLISFKQAYWGGASGATGSGGAPVAGTLDFVLQMIIVLLLIFGGVFIFRIFSNGIGKASAGGKTSAIRHKLGVWTEKIVYEWSGWLTAILAVVFAVLLGVWISQ